MVCNSKHLHFVLVPLLAQGHMIPMIDMAKVFAEHGVAVSLITTPENASRNSRSIIQAEKSGLEINLVEIPFPGPEVGLPPGCENLDCVPSRDLLRNFYRAMNTLQAPLEKFLQECKIPPSCIISDKCLSWTSNVAKKFQVPRLVFHGMGCFSSLSSVKVKEHKPHLSVESETAPFVIPEMPMKVEISKSQLPGSFIALPDLDDIREKMQEAELNADGVVVNTFSELESVCIEEYRNSIKKKVWCIGPLSLCNKNRMDMFQRGNIPSIGETDVLGWLDSMKSKNVLYVCLGSQCRLIPSQLIEIGLGLESSNCNFIWVINKGERFGEIEKWLFDEEYEERIKGRGLVIKGWAPQVLILSHKAIKGFLTHCGWNSTLEGVCFGVPMITWPMFAEQFLNEIFIVEVLGIGVSVGVELPVRWGDEEKVGVLVKRRAIVNAIERLLDEGQDGEKRRNKVNGLSVEAKQAMEEGGSSRRIISMLIQDINESCGLDKQILL